jgi:hypothetical protein
MNRHRGIPGVAVVDRGSDSLVVVVGGGQEVRAIPKPALRSTEVYSVATGRWRVLRAQLPLARSGLVAAAEPDGTVLAIGGSVTVGRRRRATAEVHALTLSQHY